MPRLIHVISAGALALAACDSPKAQPGGEQAGSAGKTSQAGSAPAPAPAPPPLPAQARPTTVLAQVQQSAPSGAHVAAADLAVTGVELFVVSEGKPGAPDGGDFGGRLVGVTGGLGGKILDLMRVVIEGKPAARTLARIALWIAQHEGEILDTPKTPEQRKAKVRPPRLAGNTLVFWVWTTGLPRMLEKATLDRSTGALDLAVPPALRGAAIASAIAALVDVNVAIDVRALQMLAAACSQPRVQAALMRALGSHPREATRAAIADVAHKCGDAAIGPLSDLMEHDSSRMVRPHAASALGRIGDGRARPSLAKAARSEDANLSWAANNALKKLR